jgi:hypothetical protein
VTAFRAAGRPSVLAVAALVVAIALPACRALVWRHYEYDEQIDLSLDGSATIFINGSVPAIVALRGIPLDPSPAGIIDPGAVRTFYESPGVSLSQITTSRRDGRRFLHLRLKVDDIRKLHGTSAFGWENFNLHKTGDEDIYTQTVGTPAGRDVGNVGWTGNELVAFRLHLPARIRYHNAPSRHVERGNLLEWEQSLGDRLKGVPIAIEARMDQQSILYSTLLLFGSMAALVVVTFAAILWWIMHRPVRPDRPA